MRPLLFLFILLFPGICGLAAQAQENTKRDIEVTENADYFGFDLRSEKDVSLAQCKQLCIENNQCRAFTYNTRVNWCFLKSDFSDLVSFEGAIAGKVVEVTTEPDIGAPPALDFLPEGMAANTRALEQDLEKLVTSVSTANPAELVNLGRADLYGNRSDAALTRFRQALAIAPDEAAVWLRISDTLNGWLVQQDGYFSEIRSFTLSAAHGAYTMSRTASARARALEGLGEALVANQLYRAAITAYGESLSLKEDENVRAVLDKLRREKGFRITGHQVEADSLSPRLCVDFSEDLMEAGADYEPFIGSATLKTPAVTISKRRICIEGFQHGETYEVTLRRGLPSQIGEELLEDVNLTGYVRDRAPAVRFTGDNFVIASSARQAIPLVGINTASADLELYRIGDRALSRLLSGRRFLTQLDGYRASDIGSDLGSLLWQGKMELENKLNRETVTSFPIAEALSDPLPGLYVLTARVSQAEARDWEPIATQWFLVTDIGLVTYAGNDGLIVFASSLDTGQPLPGLSLELIARNNEILGTVMTDDQGRAKLDPGLMRGESGLAPTVLAAKQSGGSDFAFLDLTRAGFDLSDRGVEGRTVTGPLDVFTYLDRGIYRPGETVNAISLVRDHEIRAVQGLPVTVILARPDEVEAERIVSNTPLLGGHEIAFELPENAMRGVWKIRIHSDPDAQPVSEKEFLVEDFVPDRIEFDLLTEAQALSPAETSFFDVAGRFLYGAPAANLAVEGEVRVRPVTSLSAAPGFRFGLADEADVGSSLTTLDGLPRTDAQGNARIEISLGRLPVSSRPLEAEVTVRMREDGGRAVERNQTLPVKRSGPVIGIRPGFEGGSVAEGSTARFSVIGLDASDKRVALSDLKWALYRIERNYQWYRQGAYWSFEATEVPTLVESGSIDLPADNAAEVAVPVDWGRYRLDVESTDLNGPATSTLFNAGWYVDSASTETPDALEIALDKPAYRTGDTATLNVTARHAGQLLVAIGTDRIHTAFRVEADAGDNTIEFPVAEDWGPGAYVTATLFRPGSAAGSRLPQRAIGTAWLTIETGERALTVNLDLPEQIRPGGIVEIPLTVEGLEAGAEAFVTVAAVDVGILNLTRHTPPDPQTWYFGQRAMDLEIRDLYGRLIDTSQGAVGRVRSGGDGPGLTAQGSPPTEDLFSLFSGTVRLDADGQATIEFAIPQFNGTARVMAVAWSETAVGQGHRDMVIRDPVVLAASLPKVLAPGDRTRTLIEVHNTTGEPGEYELSVTSGGLVSTATAPFRLSLSAGERRMLEIPIEALQPGRERLVMEISRNGERIAGASQGIHIRPATGPVATPLEFSLAAQGGSFTIDRDLLSDSYAQGAKIAMTVAFNRSIDLSAVLTRLDRYPYGCVEQTVSRAMPLLYLSELNAPDELTQTNDLSKRINDATRRVSSFQSANGAFGLWGPGSGNLWLDAYVTDFLTRAREKSYAVPEQVMRLAVNNLQNNLAIHANDLENRSDAIAYTLYVLARNRMASATDLRYYADTRIGDFATPLARAHLGAALALYNEQQRTQATFTSAFRLASQTGTQDFAGSYYGSPLRDGAAMLALAAETAPASGFIPQLTQLINAQLQSRTYTSTQEDAWLVLAARAVEQANRELELTVNGKNRTGYFNETLDASALEAGAFTIINRSQNPAIATVTKYASPRTPLSASSNGYEINRRYYRLDGSEAPLNAVRQNERFVVVLSVTEFEANAAQILVTDLLPGGFEIDNPRLVRSAELENFGWLAETAAAHSEFRDDRFVAAFQRLPGDNRNLQLAYVVRAVTPGQFTHPPAAVEDMYRPQRSARTATGYLEIQPAR